MYTDYLSTIPYLPANYFACTTDHTTYTYNINSINIYCNMSATTTTTLPPVATAILHHHLGNISDENERLRMKNAEMQQAHSSITNIKIHLGDMNDEDQTIVELNLADGGIIPDSGPNSIQSMEEEDDHHLVVQPFHKVDEELGGKRLLFSMKDAKSIPLSDMSNIHAARAGYSLGSFLGVHNDVFVDHTGPVPFVQVGKGVFMQGRISGLNERDIRRFRNEDAAAAIMNYVQTGTGIDNAENVEFKPFGLFLDVTPDVKKVLDLLRMLCCENPDKSLLLNKEDISEYEMTRYNIVTAISCTDTQKKVLKDNHVLKVKKAALNALSEIRGNLELPHSSGTLTIPMKEGRLGGI